MASQDFIELMKKLHDEKYKMLYKTMEYDGMSEIPSLKIAVVLEKDGNQITIQSSEPDFLKYIGGLKGVADMTGEPKFAHVKDINRYNAEMVHLFDPDHSVAKRAAEEIQAGKFRHEYSIAGLVDEFLGNPGNVKDKKFLPLKDDYHHILILTSIEAEESLRSQERLIKKFPDSKKFIDAVERILNSFKPKGNVIRDYKFYRDFANFDIDQLVNRVSTQLPALDDTLRNFVERGTIEPEIGIPKMMNVYGRFLELLKPMLYLVRVGLELKRGNMSPDKNYGLAKDIEVLKSDQEYGTLFGCLDEQIRHSDAHASIRVDKSESKVYLIDVRGGKEVIVDVYTFNEMLDMINIMQNEFFLAVFSSLLVFDFGMLLILLASKPYKFLLLAIDNCKETL